MFSVCIVVQVCIRVNPYLHVVCAYWLSYSQPYFPLSSPPLSFSLTTQAYKSQVCPHGSRCRSKAFCPHAHVLGPGGSNGVGSGGMGRSRSADGGGRGGGGGGGGGDDDEGVLCGGRRSQPGTPDGTCAGKREEEWQTVGRRGRRAPSPADSEGQVCSV